MDSPFPLTLHHDGEFGNPMLHGVVFAPFVGEISLGVHSQVIRQPIHLDLDPDKVGGSPAAAYVEVDGARHEGVERRLTFQDL